MQTIRYYFLSILFSVFLLSVHAQKQADDLLKPVIQEMAGHNLYETSRTVGFAGTVSKQYQRFQQLLTLGTEQQLTELAAQHKNAVVRLYAFQALKKKKAYLSDGLINRFINDGSMVATMNGCIADKEPVSELARRNLGF